MELDVIYNQDCIEGMAKLPDASIDMILCDLPYGTTACKWDVIIPFKPLWEQYERIIKDDGAIVLFGSEPFSSYLRLSNIKLYRHEWIWYKDKSGNFMNCKFEPMKVHENIIVFGKKKVTYNPIMELREEKNKRNNKPRLNTSNIIHTQKFFTKESKGNADYKYPTSVKYFNSVRNGLHPTQKPVALFEYLIKTYTNPGDLILDNCAGSGTTGVAAENLGRNSILIEKDPKYCEIIRKRMANRQTTLFERGADL